MMIESQLDSASAVLLGQDNHLSKSGSEKRYLPSSLICFLFCTLVALLALSNAVARFALESRNLQAQRSLDRTDGGEEEIIHVATIHLGSEYAGRLELVIKSILLFHGGVVHIHVMSDASAMETLSMMFQTWRIKRLRWSLYVLDKAHERVDFIPTLHRAGNMGFLRLFAHDILPLYVEKVILLDNDAILLEDISVINGFFKDMDKQGAFFGASANMYSRLGIRAKLPNKDGGPNVGIVMLDLKRMRETNWDDVWTNETLKQLEEFGPLTSSEQDIFTSIEYGHPNWGYRLPCEYNYQLGEWADVSFCPTGLRYDGVKLPHWTGRPKWALNETRAKYFTRIYECIEMIDWGDINGVDSDRNMSPARTLLYMKEGEKSDFGGITLSASVNFSDAFALIDRVKEWAGPVDVTVVGTDQDRMQMKNFLKVHANTIGQRISIHFVHERSNLDSESFAHYVNKLGADISRTDQLLLAFDINAMDISQKMYHKVTSVNNTDMLVIMSSGGDPIGLKTSKKMIQRFVAERKSLQERATRLNIHLQNVTSAVPSHKSANLKPTRMETPDPLFCRTELFRRKALMKTF